MNGAASKDPHFAERGAGETAEEGGGGQLLIAPTAGGQRVSRPALASPTASEQSSTKGTWTAGERKIAARPGGDDGAVGSSVAAAPAEAVPCFGSLRHPVTEGDP